jgi:Domain of unknown function (DUF4335)
MTIRRQYSLPNCTLVLDGLSDSNTTTGIPDPRPLMSSLFNAECHFVGCEQPLFGGRDFLTSLVATVSNYAQEFLSGIPHPVSTQVENSLVSLTKGDREHIHHLHATPGVPTNTGGMTGLFTQGKPTEIQLSTVQLFDLLEAIDQFLADRRTLPDIMVPLKPIARAMAQPIATQATPIGLGFASLVVASLIGYALPSPKVAPPKFINPSAPIVAPKTAPTQPKSTPSAATGTSKPAIVETKPSASPSPSPSTSPKSALPSTTGKITEATQLGFLDRKLRRDLNQNWQERGQLKQEGTFRVSVNQDGQIVNYQPIGDKVAANVVDLTPLPKLSTKNTDPNQAIGDFKVVFTPSGILQVSPWEGLNRSASLGKQIAEPKLTTTLAQQLKTKLQKSTAQANPPSAANISYRVSVTKTGEIADYEPVTQSAYDYEAQTPLPKLTKFNAQAAISQEPLAHYTVVFQPSGKVEVTPQTVN